MTREDKKREDKIKKEQEEQNEELKKQDEISRRQRLEEAKRIASRSNEFIDNNYNVLVRFASRVMKWFNSKLDFFLTNDFTAKIISIIFAIILFASTNYSGDINVFGESNVGKNLYEIPVKAVYDKNKYRVENLPETVDLSLVGSVEAIRKTEIIGQEEVIADLSNYKAGMNQKIQLLYSGIANGVSVKFSQPVYEVNIYDTKKKNFRLSSELIRVPLNTKYNYNVTLNTGSVEIKAAQHTLNSIANVKVLVDVAKKNKDFKQEATLLVIDQDGNKVENVTLSHEKVSVSVKVTKKIIKE